MIKNDGKGSSYGPDILSHNENPKQKMLDKAAKKYGKKKKKVVRYY